MVCLFLHLNSILIVFNVTQGQHKTITYMHKPAAVQVKMYRQAIADPHYLSGLYFMTIAKTTLLI